MGDEHVLQTVYEAEHRKRVVPDGGEKVELPQANSPKTQAYTGFFSDLKNIYRYI